MIKILALALALVCTLLIPVFCICLIPFLVYRYVLAALCPMFSPHILKIVSSASSVYATTNKESHIGNNVLAEIDFDDKVIYEELVAAVSKKMIQATDNRGRLLYPELTHYIVRWGGYFFWRKESDFRIQNHVELLAQPQHSSYKEDFLAEFFDPEKSPWKMLLMESGKKILFKFHHTLGDGYALLNVLMECTDEPQIRNPKAPSLPLWKILLFPILTFYEMIQDGGPSPSPWVKYDLERSDSRVFSAPRCVPTRLITEKAGRLKASFSATLFGAFGFGIQTLLKESDIPTIPPSLTVIVPFPASFKAKKLDNAYVLANFELPTSARSDETVKEIDMSLRAASKSTYVKSVHLLFQLSALLSYQGFLEKFAALPLFISSIQGPRNPLHLNKVAVSGLNFRMHMGQYNPLILNTITYNGTLTYILGADAKLFTQEMLEDLSTFIFQELSFPCSDFAPV